MATQQLFLVCDQSTIANFLQWVGPTSAWFSTCGWLQSTDTGQVMVTGLSITAASQSGSNTTYTYNSLTGVALANGRSLTITGMTNGGNNGTFRITAFTGTTSGTFTVVNGSGVTEAGSSGVVTKATSVPGSGLLVYEVWSPNDGLASYYAKIEYGNVSGTNTPSMRVSTSQTTNGAGTLTGMIAGPSFTNPSTYTLPTATVPFECDFSGSSGRIAIMLWRNANQAAQQIIAIERSLDVTGAPTASYVTFWTAGANAGANYSQYTLLFGIGSYASTNAANGRGGWIIRYPQSSSTSNNSGSFNNSIPFDTATPLIGYLDYPCTVVGLLASADVADGVTFNVTLYGSTRTYMPGKSGVLITTPVSNTNNLNAAVCIRYD